MFLPDYTATCIGLIAAGLLISAYAVVMICLDERRDRQARRRSEYGATSIGWLLWPAGLLVVSLVAIAGGWWK